MRNFLSFSLLLLLSTPAWAQSETSSYGFLSITPPLLAIVLALTLKRVIPALFAGIWLGAFLLAGSNFSAVMQGLLDTFQVYVLQAFADTDHASIILFSMMIGGMVGIISANGGMQGVVDRIVNLASTSKRAALSTYGLGMVIFFDDYANTLVVGNTMRPLSDKVRLSREKLAYVVDSTAAPVSCLALVTTWIGYEVGLIADAVNGLPGYEENAYWIFLKSIPYSFYPILTLFFVLLICLKGRDFGPMYKAELRARQTGQTKPHSQNSTLNTQTNAPDSDDDMSVQTNGQRRAINALLPIFAMVVMVVYGLWITGQPDSPDGDHSIRAVIGNANSYKALMWGSLVGVLCAIGLTLTQGLLDLEQTVQAWFRGVRSMLFAMIILVLAWALGEITKQLDTANYLSLLLGDSFPVAILPAIVFVFAAATAFATGTSWGTMAIMLPLAVPLCWSMLQANEMASPEHFHLMYSAVAAVLGGAVWGDHCSPISDTTVLSSMATRCDHIEHVRTQLPYALSVGFVVIVFGLIPSGFGVPWWLCLLVSAAILFAIVRILGKPVEDYQPTIY